MITIHADDCSPFQVAPCDAGQTIEYAYATTEGGYVRRATDRSDPSVSYEYAECNDYDEFEPQNGRVPEGPWAPAHITYEPILKGIEVEGRVDPETGAGVDALARRLTEKLGRAGQLPPKAQAEFDARERS